MTIDFSPVTVAYFVVSLVPAMILHELAHGWMAIRRGDLTPRLSGRMTLSPRPHVDPFGTVILPVLLLFPVLFGRLGFVFGYAKPMPVNPANFGKPDRDRVVVALVGPATNLVLAAGGGVAFRLLSGVTVVSDLLYVWVFVNVLVAAFHLMPIPPLDGSHVLAVYLPPRARSVYESWQPYGALFILVIFFIFAGPVFAIVDAIASGFVTLFVG